MATMQSALDQLLTDESARAKWHACFPHRPFHIRVDPGTWPSWLQDELIQDPKRFNPLYAQVEVTAGKRAQYRVSGAPVSRWVEDLGLTVRLEAVHHHLPGSCAWLSLLEQELGLPPGRCKLDAFLNARGMGLGAHCDPYEHLLIQVRGTKEVGLLPSPPGSYYHASHALTFAPSAREALERAEGFPSWGPDLPKEAERVVLTPGSMLFMPRGCYHETRGGADEVAITLVVQLAIPSYLDRFVDYLRDYLAQSARWREPMNGACPAKSEATLRDLLRDTAPQLAKLDVAGIIARRDPRSGIPPLAPELRMVRNPSILVQALPERGALRLGEECGLGERRDYPLSAAALALVDAIACVRAPISLSELCAKLPGWDAASIETTVRFLLRHQVFVALQVERLPA